MKNLEKLKVKKISGLKVEEWSEYFPKDFAMKNSFLTNVFKLCTLFILISGSLAHYDSAYFRNSKDGFTTKSKWMNNIRDSVKLSEIAIPGTHDSGSHTGKTDMVDTQCMNFQQQLDFGIRFFDIRVRHIGNGFALHHGVVYLGLVFNNFLDAAQSFLNNNPSEVVLFRIRKEHTDGDGNTRSMRDTLAAYLKNYNRYLKTSDSSITLDSARGKFIILSDYSEFNEFGINYGNMDKQDNYNLGTNWDLYGKWESINQQLAKALSGNNDQLYGNFLSGSGGSFPYFVASGHTSSGTSASRLSTGRTSVLWRNSYPDFPRVNCFLGTCTIAFEGTNILTRNKLQNYNSQMRQGKKSRTVGIIIADFPGDSLIQTIIDNNYWISK